MKVYADSTRTFTRQLLLDVAVVAWVLGWVWVGIVVHDGTRALAEPGQRAASSATRLSDSMTDAGQYLDDVPLVPGGVTAPFDKASDAADEIAVAGRASVRAVERLAFWLGVGIAAIPILLVALRYLPRRVRWVVEASAGQRFVDGPADLELFALRAMAHQPLHVLARITDDPAGAWRRGDQAVVARLAELELRKAGLRAPAPAARPAAH